MSKQGVREETKTEEEPIPFGQVFLDDIFLMLTLGLAVPAMLYLLWGMLDLANVPVWKP